MAKVRVPTLAATFLSAALIPLAACSASKDETQALQALQASVDFAESTIQEVNGQSALNRLHAGVASAELTFAVIEASDAIDNVSDGQLIQEMSDLLNDGDQIADMDLLASVVSERPGLAFELQTLAVDAGMDANQVAEIVISGLDEAAATAAGQ